MSSVGQYAVPANLTQVLSCDWLLRAFNMRYTLPLP